MKRTVLPATILALLALGDVAPARQAHANGRLQIHFMDVGQGDGAILISPQGETVLFDNGVRNQCHRPVGYLSQLGVTRIDYHVASHYHDDHIGCTAQVFNDFPLARQAFDRGGSYHTGTYKSYLSAVGTLRTTATTGQRFVLDSTSGNPVSIEFVSANGEGVKTTNENDLSLAAVVRFGQFDAEIGGDLSGFKSGGYEDIESLVVSRVGQVEVYKVHHHGSRYSSNDTWLSGIRPRVAIISAGIDNPHHHPTSECMERLHIAGARTYWTSRGGEAEPEPEFDTVGGTIIVEVAPGAKDFTVRSSLLSTTDTYQVWGATPGPSPAQPPTVTYVWSKRSGVYHHPNCRYVAQISAENRESGATPPAGKALHTGCPR